MKERPILFSGEMVRAILDGRKTQTRRPVKPHHLRGSEEPGQVLNILGRGLLKEASLLCPLGQPGDRLWVRETWACPQSVTFYRANEGNLLPPGAGWTPSIHMPRWASRITLEITAVRVERVQDITEEDAKVEGVTIPASSGNTARDWFAHLWDSIYTDWSSNPWVWVIEFRRIQP